MVGNVLTALEFLTFFSDPGLIPLANGFINVVEQLASQPFWSTFIELTTDYQSISLMTITIT